MTTGGRAMPQVGMYRGPEITFVHLEITNRCNASCPMCPRTDLGGRVNPRLTMADLRLEDVQSLLPPPFVRQLSMVQLCGNYGDPAAGRDVLEICRYIRENNPALTLGVHSNGGVQSPAWWRNLAPVLTYAVFSIDGLEDTNHLYRRGVLWDRVMRNAAAFIAGGGSAIWSFIVFRHNEHQIDQARRQAATMGFKAFRVRRTNRFRDASGVHEVRDATGKVVFRLEQPRSRAFRHQAAERYVRLRRVDGIPERLENLPIECQSLGRREIFIDCHGRVFPCCYLAWALDAPEANGRTCLQITEGIEAFAAGGVDLDGRRSGAASVVEGPFFQRFVARGIHAERFSEGRLALCAQICGLRLGNTEGEWTQRLDLSPEGETRSFLRRLIDRSRRWVSGARRVGEGAARRGELPRG